MEGDSALGCFTGDTMVALASGTSRSFADLADDWQRGVTHFGYTTNKAGRVVVAPLVEPRLTKRNAPLVRVTLDNGESVRCTPDHLFRLRDGSYRRADALMPGDSLMPLYRSLSSKAAGQKLQGYERVWMNDRKSGSTPTTSLTRGTSDTAGTARPTATCGTTSTSTSATTTRATSSG